MFINTQFHVQNQEFLAEKFDQIQEQVGFNLLAEDTMVNESAGEWMNY